jgi:hypothetical protein
MRIRNKWLTLMLAATAVLLLMNMTCYIGESPSAGSVSATVPYVPQDRSDYCAAACVVSWRLHDGLPDTITQMTIFGAMGGIPGSGVSVWDMPAGVNGYTNIHDAAVQYVSGGAYTVDQGRFLAGQISSVNAGVPVIAIQNQLHAVVIDGGNWHTDSANGYHVWDSMEYMDPQIGYRGMTPDQYIVGFCPFDVYPCYEAISSGAAAYGEPNFNAYGDTTEARGITRCGVELVVASSVARTDQARRQP